MNVIDFLKIGLSRPSVEQVSVEVPEDDRKSKNVGLYVVLALLILGAVGATYYSRQKK